MTGLAGVGSPPVGRSTELAIVDALFERAAGSGAGALLISGDPGVGKTSLVQHACATTGDSALILAGACLPLTSLTVPFLPIRSAVNGARGENVALPRLRETGGSAANIPLELDAWLEDFCAQRPVILVVDDLHWADPSTLDLLMFLLAGPADRRLAIVATMRAGEVGDTHPLRRWLADVDRLPRLNRLALGPLDRDATGEQIAGLFDAPAHASLVDDVFDHTLGNPYLTRLAVRGLALGARRLPPNLPADLESFVLRAWHQLSAPTRALAQVIAVGGRPITARELTAVVGNALGVDTIDPLLAEAVEAGALEASRDDTFWVRHPIDAEVLEQRLNASDRLRWHAAFAELEEGIVAQAAQPDVATLVAVAHHHQAAGHVADAYRSARRAADAVAAAGGVTETLRLLRRSVKLLRELPGSGASLTALLHHVASVAAEAGAAEDELAAIDELLLGVDRSSSPLLAAELLVRRSQLRIATTRAFNSGDDLDEAVRLSAVAPQSREHALALAELTRTHMWQDDSRVTDEARRAVDAARASGDPRALSYALTSQAMAAISEGHNADAVRHAGEAADAAGRARDFQAFCRAAMWEANATEVWASRRFADHLRQRREQLTALEAPSTYAALMSASEAASLFAIGDWRECLHRLRITRTSSPAPFADVEARLTGARLASAQGRVAEARGHLARADELLGEPSEYVGLGLATIRSEVHLASGDVSAALETAMAGLTRSGAAPHMCEWLAPLAARALADQVQSARDAGSDPAPALARLAELTDRFPAVVEEPTELTELWRAQIAALDDLYRSEVGRARQDPENASQWTRAADGLRAAGLPWDEAYACWRAAEALLTRGQHPRADAVSMIRRGLQLANDLGAEPLQAELAALASTARIRVEPVTALAPAGETPALAGLTGREREILGHVVAGRTYREIADALVISEKTVSSHVSNLLRKTGTSNRVELSRLATRPRG